MRSVLIVSSRLSVRRLLCRLLERQDCQATALADGDEALAAVQRQSPSLLLVDLRDAEGEDLFFLGLLRRRHGHVPVISLLPGRLRVTEGEEERVLPYSSGERSIEDMLNVIARAVEDILASIRLRAWRPAGGSA
jgi:CheY-like chemotaxis protein